jgi:hypothetical protein
MSAYPNAFKIDTKLKLTKMINKHRDTLVMLIYVAPNDESCKQTYGPIKELAKKYPQYYFVFIDVSRFDDLSSEYYTVQYVPLYLVYYNAMPISQYIGLNFDLIQSNLELWTERIINYKQDNKNIRSSVFENNTATPTTPSPTSQDYNEPLQSQFKNGDVNKDDIVTKAKYLKKLFILTKQGIELTNSYSINSDLDEMIWEYNLHMDPSKLLVTSTYNKPIPGVFTSKKVGNNNNNNNNKSKQRKESFRPTNNNKGLDISKLLNNPNLSSLLALKGITQKKKAESISSSDSSNISDASSEGSSNNSNTNTDSAGSSSVNSKSTDSNSDYNSDSYESSQ